MKHREDVETEKQDKHLTHGDKRKTRIQNKTFTRDMAARTQRKAKNRTGNQKLSIRKIPENNNSKNIT